ncbi:MAG: hypothetical protein IRY95_01900 [Clostridia bacterium]|nr:hypothetical protein [Clostridia bacterium]
MTWVQFLAGVALALASYTGGLVLAVRYHPTRHLTRYWWLNLLILTVGLSLLLSLATAPLSQPWRQWTANLLPPLVFGLGYGLVQRDIPRPQPRGAARRGDATGARRKSPSARGRAAAGRTAEGDRARPRRRKKHRR